MAADWLAPLIERDAPGSTRAIVDGMTGAYSTCRTLGIAVPEGRPITRVETTLGAPESVFTPIGYCGLFRTADTPPPNHGCVASSPSTVEVASRTTFQDYRIVEGSV
ncbi:MAG TPA: hypothetical protein VLV86_21405, partial [Vicinamibacterales bacterium]|nr:hypothetical protein [Vicinamibacterales bacterium]